MRNQFKVKVENKKQLDIALNYDNVSEIILSRDSFSESDLPKLVDKIKNAGKISWILMERISRYEEKMQITPTIKEQIHKSNLSNSSKVHYEPESLRLSTDKIFEIQNLDGIIIQNLDSFAYVLRKINMVKNDKLMVELNYTMNCYNVETKNLFTELYNEKRKNANDVPLHFTAPVELNIYELSDVGYDTIILYSYIDTMVAANCIYKNSIAKHSDLTHCKHRFDFNNVNNYSSYVLDRKNKKLYYKTYCKYCYNKIFNTEPMYLLDKIDEIETYEMKYRIDFSFENENQIRDILNMKCPESFTRGHFKNSIK